MTNISNQLKSASGTVSQKAKKLKVTKQTVRNWLRGKSSPTAKNLKKINNFLEANCRPEYLNLESHKKSVRMMKEKVERTPKKVSLWDRFVDWILG